MPLAAHRITVISIAADPWFVESLLGYKVLLRSEGKTGSGPNCWPNECWRQDSHLHIVLSLA